MPELPWLVTYRSPLQARTELRQMLVQAFSRSHAYEVFQCRCPLAEIVEVN